MKTFEMFRGKDSSGVSGTGRVLSGVIFPSGDTVVCWDSKSNVNSLGIYKNYYEFYFIHVKSHPENDTYILFDDNMKPVKREPTQKCRHCGNKYQEHPRDKQNIEEGYRRSCAGNLINLI